MTAEAIDLGDGHSIRYVQWSPDRDLNPQYAGMPDINPCGGIIEHPKPEDGTPCSGYVRFDVPGVRELEPGKPIWTVDAWEPLTLSPSVQCGGCSDHGFIKSGRWVRA